MRPWAKAAVQGAACGLVFGLVVVLGGRLWHPATVAAQAPAVAEVVKARRFEVVDAAGKVGVILGSPGLVFCDAAGHTRASLSLGSDGNPDLVFRDAAGQKRVAVFLFRDGSPILVLVDAAGRFRLYLYLNPEGSPSLTLQDKAEHSRAVLGATELETVKIEEVTMRSESSLVLFGKDGKVIWKAP